MATSYPGAPIGARLRRNAGFSLIEVVIAFVILAVGLLSLEALGIGAARMVARSERQAEFTTAAADTLEGVTFRLRNGLAFTSPSTYRLRGASMTVTATATAVADGNTMWSLNALVRPDSSRLFARADTFRISSHVFKPAP